jgi:spore coat polysaccharide biosynthesis protein SpsF
MEALNHVPAHLHILACPHDSTGAFAPLAKEAGFELCAGPKEDVLERYCVAIRAYNIDRVLRATGDNPFVFVDAAMAINAEGLALAADYAGYAGLPHGAGVEALKADALLQARDEASSPYEREHVCPYIYGHAEKFLLHRPLAPLRWQSPLARLTVDTEEDYRRAQILYAALDAAEYGAERWRGRTILETYRKLFPGPAQ